MEQPDDAGKGDLQVGQQLVAQRDTCRDQILAAAGQYPQRARAVIVSLQWPQPPPVGAQDVGEHERVERIVFVAGRPVAATQVLQLPGADHEHLEAGGEQGLHHRPVSTFDGDRCDTVLGEPVQHRRQPFGRVRDVVAGGQPAVGVDDRADMRFGCPIDRVRRRRNVMLHRGASHWLRQ